MTPAELLPIIRRDYLDEEPDVVSGAEDIARWPREFILREIGEAQRQACLRQDLRHLFDDSTAAICQVSLSEGVASYSLDSRILRIDTARVGTGNPLHHVTRAALDANWRDWRAEPAGVSRSFYIEGRRISLVPAPLTTGTLNLAVWRLPLIDPTWNTALEWPGEQSKLAHWVAYRAFLRPKPDTVSVELAKTHAMLFDQAFGSPVSDRARAELLANPPTINLLARHHRCWGEW